MKDFFRSTPGGNVGAIDGLNLWRVANFVAHIRDLRRGAKSPPAAAKRS